MSIEGTKIRRQPLHIQLVRAPILLDSENTIWPRVNGLIPAMQRRQLAVLYCFGLMGLALTPVLLLSDIADVAPCSAIVGLCATVLFWLPFICCAQRQLVLKLWTSFEFLFVYAQLTTAHVALCDMLPWEWPKCCEVFFNFLWMLGVLTMDTITLVIRAGEAGLLPRGGGIHDCYRDKRSKATTTTSAIASTSTARSAATMSSSTSCRSSSATNSRCSSGAPAFCTASARASATASCELLLPGNVEFNYAHWKQSRKQQQQEEEEEESVLQPFSSRVRSFGSKFISNFTRGRRGSQTPIVPTGNESEPSSTRWWLD